MRPKFQFFSWQFRSRPFGSWSASLGRQRRHRLTAREQQQQAISFAFHSTLMSNPNITVEMVRRAAGR